MRKNYLLLLLFSLATTFKSGNVFAVNPPQDELTINQYHPLTALTGIDAWSSSFTHSNLVDANEHTFWGCWFNPSLEVGWPDDPDQSSKICYIIVKAEEAVVPSFYFLVTGNDIAPNPGRNWGSWKIYGGNFESDNHAVRSGEGWTLIDDRVDEPLPTTNYESIDLDFNMADGRTAYQYFWIEIEKSVANEDIFLEMAEWGLGTYDSFQQYLGNNIIKFHDPNVKAICVSNWDTDGDRELSYDEAATVTDIGDVFKDNTDIGAFTELKYFVNLAGISDNAFSGCSSLTSINIPDGITSIPDFAFAYCSSLTSITIPNGVTSIGENAFRNCSGLVSITVPESVTSIGERAFLSCSGLTSVAIGNSVTNIGDAAFAWCGNLPSVTIPSSVTRIEDNAFSFCNSLTSINVEAGNTIYDSRNNCNAIIETESNTMITGCNNTTIPNSVTKIGNKAFIDCWYLNSITIPNSVTSIGEGAFQNCYSLTSVTIPNSVTNIAERAFNACDALTAMVVEEGNAIYDSRNNCNAIIETSSNTLLFGCQNTTIPNSVTTIGNNAFSGCRSLTSITIPESVTSIGAYAFQYCSSLTSITIAESVNSISSYAFDNTAWFDNQPDGLVYAGKVAYCYKGTMPGNTAIDILDGTLGIAGEAFYNQGGLISITIPESVTSIGNHVFHYCRGLTSITIPNGVTTIGDYAFSGCSSLTSIEIPNSVTSIGEWAFGKCSNLTSVTIPNSVTSIGESAFSGCSGLTSITIPNSVTSIGDYAFSGCSGLTSITIPNSATSIGDYAFQYCSGLSSIKVGMKTPISIHEGTFASSYYSATLYVPFGSKAAFQAANPWALFGSIVECNYIDVENQSIAAESSTTMEVKVYNFETNLVSFQMDLMLPEGVGIDKTGCKLSSRISDKEQELTIGKLESGAYRITSTSLSLTPICGNDGTLLTLKLTAEEGCVGGQATISNIIFSTSESEKIVMSDESFDIGILYKVIYMVDDEVYKTDEFAYNSVPALIDDKPTKEGYTFSGWSELPGTMPNHNVTITGSFSANSYELTYMVNGEVYKTESVVYGTTIIPEAGLTKEGYTFSGWSEIPETMPARDVVVTGTFTINSYKLTYIVDGGEYKTLSVVYGTTITPEAEPTKDGYTFGGWSELPETMPAHDVEITGRFYLFGDVNTDEDVDVVDVVDIARFVVAKPSVKFREKLADLNRDNTVNIADAVTLVNHIAGNQNFAKAMVPSGLSYNYDQCQLQLLSAGQNTLSLYLDGEADFTAFQFDVDVPEGTDISAIRINGMREDGHQLLYNKVEDNRYRVTALSLSNAVFKGNMGKLLQFSINGQLTDDICVHDIHFVTKKGTDIAFDSLYLSGNETGIININGNGNDVIYDLQGRKLSKVQHGVNIINGKKVVNK